MPWLLLFGTAFLKTNSCAPFGILGLPCTLMPGLCASWPLAAGIWTLSPLPFGRRLLWGCIIVIAPFGQASNPLSEPSTCLHDCYLRVPILMGDRLLGWLNVANNIITGTGALFRPGTFQHYIFLLSFLFWSMDWYKLIFQRVYGQIFVGHLTWSSLSHLRVSTNHD